MSGPEGSSIKHERLCAVGSLDPSRLLWLRLEKNVKGGRTVLFFGFKNILYNEGMTSQ